MAVKHSSHVIENHIDLEGCDGSSASFLNLPVDLLQVIFLQAGIPTRTRIDPTARPIPPVPTKPSPEDLVINEILAELGSSIQEEICYDHYSATRSGTYMAFNLMLTCRLFYRQTIAALCKHNDIVLSPQTCHDLRKVLLLSSTWIESLKTLTLSQSGPFSGCTECCKRSPTRGLRALSLNIRDDQLYIETWQKVWTEAMQTRLPATAQLSLQLIGRVADEKTARSLLWPLLQSSRRLVKHCSIRLIGLPNKVNLRSLIAAAVISITSDVANSKQTEKPFNERPFRFSDLPVELRQTILRYTDLVSPWQEVQWCNRGSNWGPPHNHGPGYLPSGLNLAWKASFQPRCCEDHLSRWPDHCGHPSDGFFCQKRLMAATSEPSLCCSTECWAFPIDLVIVSRQMHREGMEVFFRYNRLVVLPNKEDENMTWKILPKRLPISIFISQQMTAERSYWHNIRFLDIVFPCITSASCVTDDDNNNALQEWTDSLMSIKDHLNLPQLTIQLTIARWWTSENGTHMKPESYSESTYMACYARLLRPIRVLAADLARLYVLLPRIDRYEAGQLFGAAFPDDDAIIDKREDMERALEKVLMGEDYDAVQAGKCVQLHSRWLKKLHYECRFWYLGD